MTESLVWVPAAERLQLLACPVRKAVENEPVLADVQVAEIDPALADTEALCSYYDVDPDESANCVVVAGRRGDQVTYAACLVLATTRADVNGVVRRHLGARKASFAPLAEVVTETGMEFGGITPVGLPASWQLLIAESVANHPRVVIGSGLRHSKLRLPGSVLAALPGAHVLPGLAG
jgi:prolyl-tRNA editing enzyme YbaK/EbsC (Cys-tRNA(Pro) deacylase)